MSRKPSTDPVRDKLNAALEKRGLKMKYAPGLKGVAAVRAGAWSPNAARIARQSMEEAREE